MALKILVAEDETRLNYLVCNYLKGAGYEVVGVTDGEAALDAFYTNYFSLVILDIMMPKMDGLEVCREIRKESNVPIVMLTARNTEFDELRGFETGADEYIAKPFSPKILVTRVNSVLKRAGLLQDNEIVLGKLKIHLREHNVYVEEKKIPLTPREYDLLNYLVTNKNLVLSREQILGAVWEYDFDGDARTVDTHIKCLRAKLGECGDYIKTVRKYGYKLEVPEDETACTE